MNTSLSTTAAVPGRRISIFIPLAVLMMVFAVVGFWDDYFRDLFFGETHARWRVHLHAAVSMGWLVLVALQAYFAMTRRVALHVAMGRWGMWFGVAVMVIGLGFALLKVAERAAAEGAASVERQFTAPLVDMLVFSIFLGGAWITRRRPDYHKRFILLATTALVIAGVGRMPWFNGSRSIAAADVIPFLLVWLSPVLVAMTVDWIRQRRIHVVYIFGIGLMVLQRYREILRQSDAWRDFMHWLAGVLT
jgi:hypothetical protein